MYGEKPVEFIKDVPTPKGNAVRVTSFHDFGLATCKIISKSSNGLIILICHTPVDWNSKMQKPVETATYGSKI